MLKRTIQKAGIIIQKIIISVLLFLIYYLVFGFTVITAFLFNRKMLTGKNVTQDTSWLEAVGYNVDLLNSKMQS